MDTTNINEITEDIEKLKKAKKELIEIKKYCYLVPFLGIASSIIILNNKFDKSIGYQYDLLKSPTYKEYIYDIVDSKLVKVIKNETKEKSENGKNIITIIKKNNDKITRNIYLPDAINVKDAEKLANNDTSFLDNVTPNISSEIDNIEDTDRIDAHLVAIDYNDYKLTKITKEQQTNKLKRLFLVGSISLIGALLLGEIIKLSAAKSLLKKYKLDNKIIGADRYCLDDYTINKLEKERNNIKEIKRQIKN